MRLSRARHVREKIGGVGNGLAGFVSELSEIDEIVTKCPRRVADQSHPIETVRFY
jgi:hypothetical protein